MTKRAETQKEPAGVAYDGAQEDLNDFASELRESFDNMPESLQNGERAQSWSNAADTIEGISWPDLPSAIDDVVVSWTVDRRKTITKGARLTNFTDALNAVKDAAEAYVEQAKADEDEGSESEVVESFQSELQDVIDELEGIDFQ